MPRTNPLPVPLRTFWDHDTGDLCLVQGPSIVRFDPENPEHLVRFIRAIKAIAPMTKGNNAAFVPLPPTTGLPSTLTALHPKGKVRPPKPKAPSLTALVASFTSDIENNWAQTAGARFKKDPTP